VSPPKEKTAYGGLFFWKPAVHLPIGTASNISFELKKSAKLPKQQEKLPAVLHGLADIIL